MSAPDRRSAIQCFHDVGGNLDLMNEHAHWFELACPCNCYAVLAFAVESIESGEMLVACVYDFERRETIPVDHPAIVLRADHNWPPAVVEFAPYAYALEICRGLKEQRAIFEAKIAPGGRHTDGELQAPHLVKQDVIKILRFAF